MSQNVKNRVDKSDEPLIACCGYQGPCETGKPPKWRRQNTAYADDNMNWICACDDCAAGIDAGWKEQWDEVYADQQESVFQALSKLKGM